ncbi:5-methylcytosine restriction system specificity protein McrC [Mesorhizobium sp. ArgA1]
MFPREDLFDARGRSLLLPETRELKAIEMREVLEGVQLRANGLIGYLPLTSSIVLNLTPKFPIQNLWRMLSVADTDYDTVLPVLRSYQVDNAVPPHELLARGFGHYLSAILTVGVTRGYYQEPYRGHFKPKVNFGRTVGGYLSRGDELNVASDAFAFSAGLYPNALLKSACVDFVRVMPRGEKWAADRRLIGEALNALASVRPTRMRFGEQSSALALPVWLQDSYFGALTVYAMLLGFSRIGFSYASQGTELPSFLFSLDSVFESYVRNTFREQLRERKIAVLDGNASRHQGLLFLDSRRYPIKPDLIFRRKKVVLAIGEVKYKEELKEQDRYQVISHAVATGAPIAVWVSPASLAAKPGIEYVGTISTGTKFYHYLLDISGDLDVASTAMVNDVSKLLDH